MGPIEAREPLNQWRNGEGEAFERIRRRHPRRHRSDRPRDPLPLFSRAPGESAMAGIVVCFRLEVGMSRASQIVFVTMALLFAQLQCVAACASQLCGGDFKTEQAPPCHRHHDHSHDQTPGSCTRQPIVSPATSPHTLQADAPILSVLCVIATMSVPLPADSRTPEFGLSATSPPKLKSPSSTVLRI